MKLITALLLPFLASCNALGGIPPETIDAIASAGGGCVAIESLVMGKAVVMIARTDTGVITNGGVNIGGQCAGLNISNSVPMQPVPSTVDRPR
jgi:hypothetical protein